MSLSVRCIPSVLHFIIKPYKYIIVIQKYAQHFSQNRI